MLSNRTANFKVKDEQSVIEHNEAILKKLTTPLPKLEFNFNCFDEKEKEKENSNFSFKNDLLAKETYNKVINKECNGDLSVNLIEHSRRKCTINRF